MSAFAREIVAGGGSTAIVSALLNPVDVVKTRRQLERFRCSSAVEIARGLYREGGVVALWRPGLVASCSREMVYSGCTKGLYPHVRGLLAGGDTAEVSLSTRVAAASATGFLGSIGANAFDVVKIRQFDAPGRYAGGLLGAMTEVAREEGVVRGLLLRGASASAPRGAAIAVGEVTTCAELLPEPAPSITFHRPQARQLLIPAPRSKADAVGPRACRRSDEELPATEIRGRLCAACGHLAHHGRGCHDCSCPFRPAQIAGDGVDKPSGWLRVRPVQATAQRRATFVGWAAATQPTPWDGALHARTRPRLALSHNPGCACVRARGVSRTPPDGCPGSSTAGGRLTAAWARMQVRGLRSLIKR